MMTLFTDRVEMARALLNLGYGERETLDAILERFGGDPDEVASELAALDPAANDMAAAHGEGMHADLPREDCPECALYG